MLGENGCKMSKRQLSAEEYVKQALARSPSDLEGQIADCTEAIGLDPTNGAAYYCRGLARYYNHQGNETIADFDEAIRLNPKNELAHFYRGLARVGKGDYDLAIADFSEVIRLDPDESEPWFARGT